MSLATMQRWGAALAAAALLAGAAAAQQPPPPPCPALDAAALRGRWGVERTAAVVRAIRENDQRTLQTFTCAAGDGRAWIDLRGLSLEGVELEGPYVLQDADLSYGNLRNARITNGQLPRLKLENVDASGLQLVGSDISNSVFRNVHAKDAPVLWERVTADGVRFDSVFLPRARIRGSTFYGAVFDYVDLSMATLHKTVLGDVRADRLNLWSATIDSSRLGFQSGTGTSLERAVLTEVDLSRSTLRQPNLAVGKVSSINTFGLHLREPVLRGMALDNFDWRYVIWDDHVLGDEAELDRQSAGSASEWKNREAEHNQIVSLYSQIASLYRKLARDADAHRFQYRLREFQRRHEPWYSTALQAVFLQFPDQYGTSGTQLLWAALVSLGVFALVFVVWHYVRAALALWPPMRARGRFQDAWCVLVHRDRDTGSLTREKTELATGKTWNPLVVGRAALLMSFTMLLLFADRLLNIEGFLDEVLRGVPQLRGSARFIGLLAALWGVYLAFRGLALLA